MRITEKIIRHSVLLFMCISGSQRTYSYSDRTHSSELVNKLNALLERRKTKTL